jgi:hypothetical protein
VTPEERAAEWAPAMFRLARRRQWDAFVAMLVEFARHERETCAQIADKPGMYCYSPTGCDKEAQIAAAIRARGVA